MLKNVILDYGLVLCHPPEHHAIERISRVFGIDHSTFWLLYERNRGLYDRGDLSPDDYWERFAQDTGKTIDEQQIRWLRENDIEMWSHLEKPLLQWVDALRTGGRKTSILSNLNKEFTAHMRTKCDWINRFDCQVFSSEVGVAKPDPEIYRHCLRLLQGVPSESLFVDDREANVLAAREIGMTALQYRSTNQLRAELEAMGFDILPPTVDRTDESKMIE